MVRKVLSSDDLENGQINPYDNSDGDEGIENQYSKVRRPPLPPIRNELKNQAIYDLVFNENNPYYDEVPPLEGFYLF